MLDQIGLTEEYKTLSHGRSYLCSSLDQRLKEGKYVIILLADTTQFQFFFKWKSYRSQLEQKGNTAA